MTISASPESLSPAATRRKRRDAPALIHLAIQIVATLGFASSAAALSSINHLAAWVATVAFGVCVLTFFPLLHEAGHQTAFATSYANEFGVWLGALMMLQAPSFFREFHWEHHRSTQDPDTDPEISDAPEILDGFPRDPFSYFFLVSGQFLMVGKLGFTIVCALLPASLWRRLFPFVRESQANRLAWESRCAILLIGSFAAIGLSVIPGFTQILWGWPIAHLLLGFYLMPEHTGLPNDGDQIHRTRTVISNRWIRALMWNMPYHAEHHADPGVPYHALPALHEELKPRLEHVSLGYWAFHKEAAARALRLR